MSAGEAKALMCSAFLPSATAAMAVAVSGYAHAGELLAELTRRGLFAECREGTVAAYTCHALFSDFWRAQAAETLHASVLRALRVQAANVLTAHGQADAAITLLTAAEPWGDRFFKRPFSSRNTLRRALGHAPTWLLGAAPAR